MRPANPSPSPTQTHCVWAALAQLIVLVTCGKVQRQYQDRKVWQRMDSTTLSPPGRWLTPTEFIRGGSVVGEQRAARPVLVRRAPNRAPGQPSRRRPESTNRGGSRCEEHPGYPDTGEGVCSAPAKGPPVEFSCPRAPWAVPRRGSARGRPLPRRRRAGRWPTRPGFKEAVPVAPSPIRAAAASVA